MSEYERVVRRILKTKGFDNIRKTSEHDLEASKEGVQYAIEVKGSQREAVFPLSGPKWTQIRALHENMTKGKRSFVIFVNIRYCEFAIFEMVEFGLAFKEILG